jgi:hypothetical protein
MNDNNNMFFSERGILFLRTKYNCIIASISARNPAGGEGVKERARFIHVNRS